MVAPTKFSAAPVLGSDSLILAAYGGGPDFSVGWVRSANATMTAKTKTTPTAWLRCDQPGHNPQSVYAPPTVRPSMRMVGEATEPRNSRSFAISEIWKNISLRFPATVISSTG